MQRGPYYAVIFTPVFLCNWSQCSVCYGLIHGRQTTPNMAAYLTKNFQSFIFIEAAEYYPCIVILVEERNTCITSAFIFYLHVSSHISKYRNKVCILTMLFLCTSSVLCYIYNYSVMENLRRYPLCEPL